MRLLKRLLLAIVLTAPAGIVTAAPACQKEIYIYFDVSGSMYEPWDGRTAQELFTGSVSYLLRAESFADPQDRIVVVAFAETAATLFDGSDARAAAAVIESIERSPPEEGAVGGTNSTNLVAVLNDILKRIDPTRKQIFIIASDFAHHPDGIACGDANRRMLSFKTAARRNRESFSATPVKVALLTDDVVGDTCGGANQEVSQAVRGAFRQILHISGEVPIKPATNIIASELRQVIADPIRLTQDTGVPDLDRVTIRASNPNPFPVTIKKVTLSSPDGKTAHDFEDEKTIACRSEEVIPLDVPSSLKGMTKLMAAVDATTPPVPLDLPSAFVLITRPEVYVFPNLGKDTYVVELAVEKTSHGETMLKVSGIPGAEEKQYKVEASHGLALVALTVPGTIRVKAEDIKVTANEDLYVRTEEGVRKEAESHGKRPSDSGGEHAPFYLQWCGVISGIGMLMAWLRKKPAGVHKWWERFHLAHGIHVFYGALDAAVSVSGFISATFAALRRYAGILSTTVQTENVLWAAAAGGISLWVYRWLMVCVVWRFIERRLLSTKRAVLIRTLIAAFGIFVAFLAAHCIYSSMPAALHNSTFVHPESRP
jgi:hypothetical protein